MSARNAWEIQDAVDCDKLPETYEQDNQALNTIASTLGDIAAHWPPSETSDKLGEQLTGVLHGAVDAMNQRFDSNTANHGLNAAVWRTAVDRSFTGLYDIAELSLCGYLKNRVAEGSQVQPTAAATVLQTYAYSLSAGGLFITRRGALSEVSDWVHRTIDDKTTLPTRTFSDAEKNYANGVAHSLDAKRSKATAYTFFKSASIGVAGILLTRRVLHKA